MILRLPKFINKTLSVRLSLMVVSAMALLLIASLMVLFFFSRRSLKEEALQTATRTLDGTTQRIDNILLGVEQASGNIYLNMIKHLDRPDMMEAYCRRLVMANGCINGCAIAFKPYFYPERKYFISYAYRVDSDSLAYSEQPVVQPENYGDCPYTEQEWFVGALKDSMPRWDVPPRINNVASHPFITFSLPILNDQREIQGVVSVDVKLDLFSQIVTSVKPSPHSYCMLLDDEGSYIVHPDSSKLQQRVLTTVDHNYASDVTEAAKAMVSGETGYRPFSMNGIDYYVFYKPFEREHVEGRALGNLGWSIGIVYPEDDIFGDYNLLLYDVLAIAFVSLILLFFFARIIIHRQLLPLRMLTKSAQHISKGNYVLTSDAASLIPESQHHDEIARLQDNFRKMQQTLSVNISELNQLQTTLEERGKRLRQAYDKAEKAARMKTAFLHNMTNQMVPPATDINEDVVAFCEPGKLLDTVEADRLAHDIQKHGEMIAELLNELLHLSEEDTKKGGES